MVVVVFTGLRKSALFVGAVGGVSSPRGAKRGVGGLFLGPRMHAYCTFFKCVSLNVINLFED